MFDDLDLSSLKPEVSFKSYLQSNIDPIYRITPGIVIIPITADTVTPFMLNNRVYCTGRVMLDTFCAIIRDYTIDGAIIRGLPNAVMTIRLYPRINGLISYINEKLLGIMMINELESPNSKTYLVRLRIVVNMIYNLSFLTSEQKRIWSEWIKELTWARMACLNSWYIKYMLPYQVALLNQQYLLQGYGYWFNRSSQILNLAVMKEEDKLLVEQARNGSEIAFNKLYSKYYKTVWFSAYKIVHNSDVADDITSIVFTKVYLKFSSYTNHISFEMWLKTITVNTAIDYIRRNKKEQLNNYIDEEESTIQLSGLDKSPEENFIYKQNVDIVMNCIGRLKKRYRDLIYARLDGKSYQQISEELAIPEATVKSCLNKARARLKELFNQY